MEEKKKLDIKALMKMDINDLLGKHRSTRFGKIKSKKPQVQPKSVVSFDFGSDCVKIVEGRYLKKELKVTKAFTVAHDHSIEDGTIANPNRLVELLRSQLHEHGIKAKYAICTINSTQIINRELLIPYVEEEEMETVVRYEIQQFLPINMADYLIQYVVLDEVIMNNEKRLKLNVVTFPEKIASSYYDLLTQLELKPFALDVTYNSISKLANYSHLLEEVTDKEGTVAFVDMGAQSIDLNIFAKGNVQFTRLIKSGGYVIEERLNQIPDMSIKSTASLEHVDLNGEDMLARVVRLSLDEMIYELERVLQFYRNKSVGNKIDYVYIFGGYSNIPGLGEYMGEKIGIPTAKLHRLKGVELEVSSKSIPTYANAIGAIIRL
ncbi:MAG: type IV pilus assembly protein PilM [Turicibacter sp.]|nr:type IV pilus assembly protein PilM [Turicibacter sp.]